MTNEKKRRKQFFDELDDTLSRREKELAWVHKKVQESVFLGSTYEEAAIDVLFDMVIDLSLTVEKMRDVK